MSGLPKVIKDYRAAVTNHVLCPGVGGCNHDHASVERRAAQALVDRLALSADLAKALEECLYVFRSYESNDMGHPNSDVLNAEDEARSALAAYRKES